MKLLITGAGGFVGAAVSRQAVAAGHDVIGIMRRDGQRGRLAPLAGQMRVVEIDLRDSAAVASLVQEARPEAIIHVAWSGVSNKARSDRSQIANNIDAACNLVDAGITAGITKFVGVGSQGEYGNLSGRITERDLPDPTSLYGASKLAVMHLAGQLSAQAGVGFAWLRLFAAYGPGDNPFWLIPSLINQMLAGSRPKTTLGTQLWDYLFIDDVARGILAAAETPNAVGVFNLGSGQPRRVSDIVTLIRDLAAPEMELVFGEIPYQPNQVWHMEAAIDRLMAATGWSPTVDLQSGLSETVAWHRGRPKHGLV